MSARTGALRDCTAAHALRIRRVIDLASIGCAQRMRWLGTFVEA